MFTFLKRREIAISKEHLHFPLELILTEVNFDNRHKPFESLL